MVLWGKEILPRFNKWAAGYTTSIFRRTIGNNLEMAIRYSYYLVKEKPDVKVFSLDEQVNNWEDISKMSQDFWHKASVHKQFL